MVLKKITIILKHTDLFYKFLQTSPLKTGKGHLDLNNLKYDKTAADRFSLTSRYAQNPDFIANLKLTAENRHLATEALSNKKLQKMLDRYADDRDKINQVNKFITQINDKNINFMIKNKSIFLIGFLIQ